VAGTSSARSRFTQLAMRRLRLASTLTSFAAAAAIASTECKDKLDELREEHRRTGTVARRDTTVAMIVGDWLANMPPRIKSPISKRC